MYKVYIEPQFMVFACTTSSDACSECSNLSCYLEEANGLHILKKKEKGHGMKSESTVFGPLQYSGSGIKLRCCIKKHDI